MGCRSDYSEPSKFEKELSKVYSFLDEIKTGKLQKDFDKGTDSRVYSKNLSQSHLDDKTAELCGILSKTGADKYSLEMQIWWRDHQEFDKKRKEQENKEKKLNRDRKKALSKLTDYEIKILGIRVK